MRNMMIWKSFLATAAVIICTCSVSLAFAQAKSPAYPSKPVRIIVPYQPGGITDRLARQVGQKLTTGWGQQVVVENRPGGSTNIGSEAAARAAPDGYTLLWAGIANAVAPALYPNLSYDPLRDFIWVTNLAKFPVIVVAHPALPARNAQDIVRLAKPKPGAVLYVSPGVATSGHLAAELFQTVAGVRFTHVPYKGSAGALVDVISGQVMLYLGPMASPMPHVRSGRLRALAVTSAKRVAAAPEIPTLDEQGLRGYEFTTWFGVAVPKGTPGEVVTKLNTDIARIIALQDVREQLVSEGAEFVGDSSRDFTAFVTAEVAKLTKLVKEARIKAE